MILLSYATKEDYDKKNYTKREETYDILYDVMYDRKTYADFLYNKDLDGSEKPKLIASRIGSDYDSKFYIEGGEQWKFANIMPEDVLRSLNRFVSSIVKVGDFSHFTKEEVKEMVSQIRDHIVYTGYMPNMSREVQGIEVKWSYASDSILKVLHSKDITDEMVRDFEKLKSFVSKFGFIKGIDCIEFKPELIGKFKSVYLIGGEDYKTCIVVAKK